MRIMREIPPAFLIAGIKNIDLRKDIEEEIRKNNIKIKEIRFREIGFALRDKKTNSNINSEINSNIKIKKTIYKASDGKEIFLQAVNKNNILFGVLRLRFEKDKTAPAIIRELHIYGPALNLGKREKQKSQHKGLGKKLLKQAEQISKKSKHKSIKIISGVGVREYYKKFGYKLDKEGIYMEKSIF
jgi:elongator complex protein 3